MTLTRVSPTASSRRQSLCNVTATSIRRLSWHRIDQSFLESRVNETVPVSPIDRIGKLSGFETASWCKRFSNGSHSVKKTARSWEFQNDSTRHFSFAKFDIKSSSAAEFNFANSWRRISENRNRTISLFRIKCRFRCTKSVDGVFDFCPVSAAKPAKSPIQWNSRFEDIQPAVT